MKANEFRDLTRAELEKKLTTLKTDLFSARFKMVTGQLDNTNRVSQLKKDIARAKTVLKETEGKENV
jgi:large subunit ribosomal protein L29